MKKKRCPQHRLAQWIGQLGDTCWGRGAEATLGGGVADAGSEEGQAKAPFLFQPS